MTSPAPHFLDLSLEEVRQTLAKRHLLQDAPRLPEQAFRGVHQQLAERFSSIPGMSRRRAPLLEEAFRHEPLELLQVHGSWDGSARYGFRLKDGAVIESVLIPHHGRHTVCLSSQAGCALACRFCATGLLGLRRNLEVHEMVGQVLAVARHSGRRISDLVFMGMGEPLHNEYAVIKTCDVLAHAEGAQISRRRMVISTAGVVPAIRRFTAAGHRMALVFSLVSAVPEKRALLMPIQKNFGFFELLDAIREYQASRPRKHVTLEYIAIRGLTLGDDDLAALKQHLAGLRCILNVIPLNPVDAPLGLLETPLESPTLAEVKAWTERLRPLGFPVKIRRSAGRDQLGGCGQLGATLTNSRPLPG